MPVKSLAEKHLDGNRWFVEEGRKGPFATESHFTTKVPDSSTFFVEFSWMKITMELTERHTMEIMFIYIRLQYISK